MACSSASQIITHRRRGVKERVQAQTSRFHGVRLNKRTKKWEVRTA